MRTLIAEDDFVCRVLLQQLLTPYGQTDVAVDGAEAVMAVKAAYADGRPYDLLCLDIMMPEMDGQAVLREVRDLEESNGIIYSRGMKIIMTTALDDPPNVFQAFQSLCDGYLTKPIYKEKLIAELKKMGLIK